MIRHPNYREPLLQVWTWNREGTAGSLKEAEQLARELKGPFTHALLVRYELALSLVKQKRRSEAVEELTQAGREFSVLDEDTLCLWARCHKDQGDERLQQMRLAEAERHYGLAEERYEQAFSLRRDRFPGINMATLRLLRASLHKQMAATNGEEPEQGRRLSEQLLEACRETAMQLLKGRAEWQKRLQDDDIWMPATEAEAQLLLGRWSQAADCYRMALDPMNKPLPFHFSSMAAQAERIIEAYRRLDMVPEPPLDEVLRFFEELKACAA